MTDVIDVASYVLEITGRITTMKLQKLVFYAQALHLVQRDSPLFGDRIEAWAFGPVAPRLYAKHRHLFWVESLSTQRALSEEEKSVIDRALSRFGHLTGEQLSDMTHCEEPWLQARKSQVYDGNKCRAEIPQEAIRSFYTAHWQDSVTSR